MKRASVTLILSILVPLATLFIAGDGCGQVPSMRWTDACFKACNTPPLSDLCHEMLQHTSDLAEVTYYAIVAARLTRWSYDNTVAQAARQIASGSLPGEERPAYQHCIDRYATARNLMVSVITELVNCDFTHTRQQYIDAMAAVKSCGDGLAAGTALAPMNAADHDKTMVAYDLGALIVGK